MSFLSSVAGRVEPSPRLLLARVQDSRLRRLRKTGIPKLPYRRINSPNFPLIRYFELGLSPTFSVWLLRM
jgi:hypothetical protein